MQTTSPIAKTNQNV